MTYYQNAAGLPPEQTICVGALVVPRIQANFVQLTGNITTATTTDLYTVPAGKTAIIPVMYTNNVGLSANTTSVAVKISGSYYRISTDNSFTSAQAQARSLTYIFNSGETLAFITSTTSQINYRAAILEIPNEYGVSSKVLTSFTGGGTPDALYTLPANTKAFVWGSPPTSIFSPAIYVTPNNAAVNYFVYVVPNGSSPSLTDNVINLVIAAGSTSVNFLNIGTNLENAGDSIMISSNSTNSGQLAWVNIIEIPINQGYQNLVSLALYQSLLVGPCCFNNQQIFPIFSLNKITTATTTDLYTVPSGYKFLFRNVTIFGVSGTITYILKVKIGGNYYFINIPTGTSVGTGTQATFEGTFVVEAGDSISVTSSGASPIGIAVVMGILVPNTTPILTSYRTTFSGGGTADTLYSLPGNKEALACTIDFNVPFTSLVGTIGLTQTTGSSRAYNVYNVLSGGSAGSTNLSSSISGVGNNSSINKQTGLQVAMSFITSGDKVMISSDSSASAQFAWINIIEVDA